MGISWYLIKYCANPRPYFWHWVLVEADCVMRCCQSVEKELCGRWALVQGCHTHDHSKNPNAREQRRLQ